MALRNELGQFRGPTANFPGNRTGGLLKFVPNPALHAELRAAEAYQAALREAAHEIAVTAEIFTHQYTQGGFMPRPGEPLFAVEEASEGGVIVINTDHGGHLYEFGALGASPPVPAIAPLRRAVRAVGLEFEVSGQVTRGF